MLWLFNSQHVSDTDDFRKLQKCANFGADSEIFEHCCRGLQHVALLSNETICSEIRFGMDRRISYLFDVVVFNIGAMVFQW